MFRKECRLLVAGLFAFFLYTAVIAQKKPAWQIQTGSITTRWSEQVSAGNVLPDYPRPQLVRNNWINLNGVWEYTITPKHSAVPTTYTGSILVPYPIESALSGVRKKLKPEELLWYRRRFTKPSIVSGQRVLLHFGAVDYESTIFINGEQLMVHTGGYQHFTIDITDNLLSDNNELVVKVWDPTDAGPNPHGKQALKPEGIMYTPSSGIWQTVWMEVVAQHHIETLKITPNIDSKSVAVEVVITDGGTTSYDDFNEQFNTNTALPDFSINVLVKNGNTPITCSFGPAGKPIIAQIKSPRLWSPDNPFLYDLRIQLVKNGKVVDEIGSYFGMRKISIKKDENGIDRIFLNNKYTYNLGTLDQGFWPDGLYTAPTDEALQFDIKAVKAMGFNTIRKHIKLEPDRWYYHADKLGMLIWQDMINPGNDTKEARNQFEKENKINIAQLYNHPCIITWVLFNEKWGQYDQERLTKWIKEFDPTRLVNGHSGEMLYVNNQLRSPAPNAWVAADMTDVHSYPFPRNVPNQPGKAMVLGEFGGIGVPVESHLWDDLATGWGYDGVVTPPIMQKQYTAMLDSLKVLERQGLSGSIYTQPFDVESEQNGLLTYDRAVIKLPADTLRDIHSKIWPATSNYFLATKGFSAKVANPSNKPYAELLREYNSGRRDSAFLRKLTLVAQKNKDTITVVKASNEYIQMLHNPLLESNLKFIAQFTNNTRSRGFKILLNNVDRANEVLDNMAETRITLAIEADEIAPYTKKGMIPDWQAMEKSAIDKYGDLGQESVWQTRVFYSINHKDWETFGKALKVWFEKYGHKRPWLSPDMINRMAWTTFENTDNRNALEAVATMSAHGLKQKEMIALLDTYANLLYKLGQKSEALQWQKKAVAAAPADKELKTNLEKMQRGEPTWPNVN
ncbi:sugar-binding domain-containing protein [Chitinophaga sp. S165]|uniref:sugar-binding domain-containing protein n=1 Tax=Chitinophaga sp. S165 TaxID=2135462 RepID=UPI000D714DDA|nr:sugar-binding domain-containing protein [Chitinophaga sp. S165]PWV55496.1 glycosyl hydrolase family 2 [Chitinophaga sp. S165]